jgi:hypothetical protein
MNKIEQNETRSRTKMKQKANKNETPNQIHRVGSEPPPPTVLNCLEVRRR